MNQDSHKRRLPLLLLFGFMITILISAYAVNQVHIRSLPVITVTSPTNDSIRKKQDTTARFLYAGTVSVCSPETLTVQTVKTGPHIRKGEAIIQFSESSVTEAIQKKHAELELLSVLIHLGEQNGFRMESSVTYQDQLSESIRTLESLLSDDCRLYSPVDGYIMDVFKRSGEPASANEPILRILDESTAPILTSSGHPLESSFTVMSVAIPVKQNSGTAIKNYTLPVTRNYEPNTGTVQYAAFLPQGENYELLSGQELAVLLLSEEKEYALTLPLACLHQGQNGEDFVYILQEEISPRGTVLTIKQRTVYVLDRDQTRFAVSMTVEKPVVLSDEKLYDGCEVRMRLGN